ncbi:hypothetical protein TWF718_010837 [Orbilia javanica]|uniref:F-box domain-containing protein n=1 Tax=Orbilia javanica TaxID=47235 RepID=A0AAN8RC03_9PEZI
MPKKILKRALKRLHVVRKCDDEPSPPRKSKNIKAQETLQLDLDSEFLNLPLDIFNLILTHLTYADIVSLSLTTKSLRYICPDPSSKASPGPGCRNQAYKRSLPSNGSGKAGKKPILGRTHSAEDSNSWGGRCSYCTQPLCPPTCSSALILDYRTGIFYPASLYPFHVATSAPTDGFPETSGCHERFMPGDKLSLNLWSNSPPSHSNDPVYKTIWCEHHRCPASLLKDNYLKEDAPLGAYRFYGDYYSDGNWAAARSGPPRNPRGAPFVIPHTKFLVGYRKTPLNDPKISSRPSSSSHGNNVEPLDNVVKFYKLNLNNGIDPSFDPERDQEPIDEQYFYDTLCRHCFLPLRRSDSPGIFWSRRTCDCAQNRPFKSRLGEQSQNPMITKPGCRGCGVVSVKFTVVEAFTPVPAYDSHIHFSLVLASEMQIGTIRPRVGERQLGRHESYHPSPTYRLLANYTNLQRRLFPLDSQKEQRALKIIRYEPIIPLPPKATRGFQNLPSSIISRIIVYVLLNTRYRKPRYIAEARRLILYGWADWSWANYHNAPTGTCSECRKFKNLDRETRLRSTWRCTDDCNYGFHMFMTKGSMRGF